MVHRHEAPSATSPDECARDASLVVAHGLVLIGGGVRSGKSRFALSMAERLPGPRTFLATAQAFDHEMEVRITRHKAERTDRFATLETPIDLVETLEERLSNEPGGVVLIDCLTLWLSNLLLADWDEQAIERAVQRLAKRAHQASCPVLLVTNEVGMGIVPDSALGRQFRDIAGRAHQALAAEAHTVFFAAMGLMLRLKPSPVVTLASS